MIELKRFAATADLHRVADDFLLSDEVKNSYLIGVLDEIDQGTACPEGSAYMAAVFEDAAVVAVAARAQGASLALSSCDHQEALAQLASDLRDYDPATPGVISVAPAAGQFATAWSRLTGEACVPRMKQNLYRLGHMQRPAGASGTARRATEEDTGLLVGWFTAFASEAMPWAEGTSDAALKNVSSKLRRAPEEAGIYLWQDAGQAVSLVAYGSPTPNSLHIGPVFTPPQYRRRGYAASCTAAVCDYIFEIGKDFVTLFADLANPTANHIYQAMGFEAVCGAEMISFGGR